MGVAQFLTKGKGVARKIWDHAHKGTHSNFCLDPPLSWCAKHEATYILTYSKTKTHTPQFSLLIIFLCLAYKIYSFIDLSYHTFGVPKQMPRWTFGVQFKENHPGLIERILFPEQKCASSLSRAFSVGLVFTSKMQTLQRYRK